MLCGSLLHLEAPLWSPYHYQLFLYLMSFYLLSICLLVSFHWGLNSTLIYYSGDLFQSLCWIHNAAGFTDLPGGATSITLSLLIVPLYRYSEWSLCVLMLDWIQLSLCLWWLNQITVLDAHLWCVPWCAGRRCFYLHIDILSSGT